MKTQSSFAKVRTIARNIELRNESRRDFGVSSPSGTTSTKFSRRSGIARRTKNRKIESSEKIDRKFSREWSPDIFSNRVSSSHFFKPTNQETEKIEENRKKTKKT
jgi:hypothetical protein